MTILILGLLIFLGVHSVRIVAEPWRQRMIAARGAGAWKGLYSVLAVVGFALVIWGYGLARQAPVPLWNPPPVGLRHAASLLTLIAFVMLTAAYVPGNSLKSALKHPMLLGVKTWAFAHLIVNHTLADLLLFGGFLVWAVLCFRAARARDRVQGIRYPSGRPLPTVLTVVIGVALWVAFAVWAHGAWIGVRPFG
jgi:uncharacterized membrane protein